MSKSVIYIFMGIGSFVGGLVGAKIDGTGFGMWGIVLTAIGGFAGIYIGYKIQQ